MVTHTFPTQEELKVMTIKEKLGQMTLDFMWYRGMIIHHLTEIEMTLDIIITSYFNPEMKNDFNTFILNSGFVDFGKKIKIFQFILDINKYPDFLKENSKKEETNRAFIEDLMKLNNKRNVLAHSKIAGHDEKIAEYDGNKIFFWSSKDGATTIKEKIMSEFNVELKEIIEMNNNLILFYNKHFSTNK
ncbi:MAG: hypothetical protein JNJ58_06870 [Chitinophagaceae bacterium]|nr:hypothetical protein [Chitinophagaceae bacterium]